MLSDIDGGDISSLNEIFETHRINRLKLSDQRFFIDSLLKDDVGNTFQKDEVVTVEGSDYFVDSYRGGGLWVLRGQDHHLRFAETNAMKPTGRHGLVEKAARGDGQCTSFETELFDLFSCALDLKHNDSKRFASLKSSRIDLLPHQINCVYGVLNSFNHRFLIADEVGLGKTIETGLIIKEFSIRYRYKTILIIVPASLQYQWQNELKDKFDEEFFILDQKLIKREIKRAGSYEKALSSLLDKKKKFILSLDFAKKEEVSKVLTVRFWDIIIFDEAHRLKRTRTKVSKAYDFADRISLKTKSFFLLSATPFSGKIEELYFMIKLLDRNRAGSMQTFLTQYYNRGGEYLSSLVSDITIRRTKKEVGGFTKRQAVTVKYELSLQEKNFYDMTGDYVKEEYRKALEEGKGGGIKALMLCFFQKMMDSSRPAILGAMRKRIKILEDTIDGCEEDSKRLVSVYSRTFESLSDDFDGYGDEDEEGLKDKSEMIYDLKSELKALKRLHKQGLAIKDDNKGSRLKKLVAHIKKENASEKIIIFTQFKTTMLYLKGILSDYFPVEFHGSLNKDEKDAVVELFRKEADILISTEAGGEGRNLQFARVMINYDLPWNPFKLEQRIGRIHRFGQKFNVLIYNFVMEESIGERILEILNDKIHIFEEAFGDIQPLLGQIGNGDINRIFMKFLSGGENPAEVIEKKLNISQKKYRTLTVSGELAAGTEVSTDEIKKEIVRIEKKIKKFMIDFSKAFPEDLEILNKEEVAGFDIYEIRTTRIKLEKSFVCFDYNFFQNLQKKEHVTYLHIDHPLVKFMLERISSDLCVPNLCNRGAFAQNLKNRFRIEFKFFISFKHYKVREFVKSIILFSDDYFQKGDTFHALVYKMWRGARKHLDELIDEEKKRIAEESSPLLQKELEKVRENYRSQTEELKEVLETYEFKNKQKSGNRYFLLIPKIKKQLERVKNEYQEVETLACKKMSVESAYTLKLINIH